MTNRTLCTSDSSNAAARIDTLRGRQPALQTPRGPIDALPTSSGTTTTPPMTLIYSPVKQKPPDQPHPLDHARDRDAEQYT